MYQKPGTSPKRLKTLRGLFLCYSSSMQTILISKGKTVLVDDCDYKDLMKNKWHFTTAGYAARSIGGGAKKKRTILMHRQILGVIDRLTLVDHINGNTLDNRRCNLRLCTYSQNGANRRLNKNNKTGYKGVQKYHKKGKWKAIIQPKLAGERKILFLGIYDSPEDAARAYNEKAFEIYGSAALLNDIPEHLERA